MDVPQYRLGQFCASRGWTASYEDVHAATRLVRITALPPGSPEQLEHELYKTKICTSRDQDFNIVRTCARGDLCPWAHELDQLRAPPDQPTDIFGQVHKSLARSQTRVEQAIKAKHALSSFHRRRNSCRYTLRVENQAGALIFEASNTAIL